MEAAAPAEEPAFRTGLCDMDRDPLVCASFFCAPFAMAAKNKGLIEGKDIKPGDMCKACCCYPFVVCQNRGKARKAKNIPGNCCIDLLISWLCVPCSEMQITREFAKDGWTPYTAVAFHHEIPPPADGGPQATMKDKLMDVKNILMK